MHQEFGHALRFSLAREIRDGFRVEASRIYVKARSGLDYIADNEPNE
jgi:hypothetical protein